MLDYFREQWENLKLVHLEGHIKGPKSFKTVLWTWMNSPSQHQTKRKEAEVETKLPLKILSKGKWERERNNTPTEK